MSFFREKISNSITLLRQTFRKRQKGTSTCQSDRCYLLDIPIELRIEIYKYYFHHHEEHGVAETTLLRTNHQIHDEALAVLHKIATVLYVPMEKPSLQNWISTGGKPSQPTTPIQEPQRKVTGESKLRRFTNGGTINDPTLKLGDIAHPTPQMIHRKMNQLPNLQHMYFWSNWQFLRLLQMRGGEVVLRPRNEKPAWKQAAKWHFGEREYVQFMRED